MPIVQSTTDPLRFSVLGPLRAWRGDVEIDCGPPAQRKVLALLLVAGGQPVSMPQLIDLLWDHAPPVSAANSVHRSIGLLRRQFEPDLPTRQRGQWLIRQQGNYRLNVDTDTLDLLRFRELGTSANTTLAAGQPEQALPEFLAALDLWHGSCAGGLELTARAQPTFTRIDRERLLLAQDAAAAAREAGRSRDVLPVLRELATLNPTDEGLHAELMLCLAAAGRQAEALAGYATISSALSTEIGVQPGQALRRAHEQVLRQQTAAQPSPPTKPSAQIATERVVRPAQLPPDLRVFAGRAEELARLTASIPLDGRGVPITAISGMAGVGKTTLAVHWAHDLAQRYPDGQLYVNLRGFDPSGRTLTADKALAGFLQVLGVPLNRIPADIGEQAALYRSLLAGRRVLVLLDNACDVAQVRPLLPASPGAMVIVTSRRALLGLAASHGARLVELRPFSPAESRETLALRIGADRLAAEPGAVAEVLDACGGLPLAIAVVAARALVNERLSIAEIAAELRDERTRLDALDASDASVDVRTVFSWSYQMLGQDAAALFRLLSVPSGPDISARAIAALAGQPLAQLRPHLAELIQFALLTEPAPGRYAAHDLLRSYAEELSAEQDCQELRAEARARCYDYYLYSMRSTESDMTASWVPMMLPGPRAGAVPEQLPTRVEAAAWFDREHQVLSNAVAQAAETPQLRHYSWQLALSMQPHLHRLGYWADWIMVMSTALSAATAQHDLIAEAHCHRSLAGGYHMLDRNDQAAIELARTRQLFDTLGYTEQNAKLEANFGWVRQEQHRYEEALGHFQRAVELSAEQHDEAGQALAILGIGEAYCHLGKYESAAETLERAIELYRELGDSGGEAHGWYRLAAVYVARGDLATAVDHYQHAIELHREENNPTGVLNCQVQLGDLRLSLGDRAGARELWSLALATLDELRLPRADAVRARLLELD
ncbi:MAG TPA: BTAD domain-containing putative transcriptional regulator [Pseudonocardiaceae bacterium]|nr:BTAD domain-containing putative transcriptional regulator [Pseudonocardiaceae bacterium]